MIVEHGILMPKWEQMGQIHTISRSCSHRICKVQSSMAFWCCIDAVLAQCTLLAPVDTSACPRFRRRSMPMSRHSSLRMDLLLIQANFAATLFIASRAVSPKPFLGSSSICTVPPQSEDNGNVVRSGQIGHRHPVYRGYGSGGGQTPPPSRLSSLHCGHGQKAGSLDTSILLHGPLTYRSQHTLDRIKSSQITALDSDEALVAEADIILSIVPPRDAIATARRAFRACHDQAAIKLRGERKGISSPASLTYIDLNAISPRSAKSIAAFFNGQTSPPASPRKNSMTRSFTFSRRDLQPESAPIAVDFLDGGIIGGPPSLRPDKTWKRPSIVISGPRHAEVLPIDLVELLNMKAVGDTIGPASALKACFASLSKGMIALTILSFTTAHTSGVLPALEEHLKEFNPGALAVARAGLTSMPPKAYRWVDEMRQINETFVDEGGFSPSILGNIDTHPEGEARSSAGGVFEGVADLYRLIADDTVLGEEKTEKRKRGTDFQDTVECVREGIARKKKKIAGAQGLDLAWRKNWA